MQAPDLTEHFPPGIAARVLAASDWIDEQVARGDGADVDQAKLRESLGVLAAAKTLVDAQDRGARWTADRPRLECVFELEARYEEGVVIREGAPTAADRADMDAKLLALREILNDVKAGAPITGSAGLPPTAPHPQQDPRP